MIRIYFGKSGSGKDTFLKKDLKAGFSPIIPITTRPMRVGETDGVDYNFISTEKFRYMIGTNKFTEHRHYNVKVNGKNDVWYYGTPLLHDVDKKNYVYVTDITGIKAILSKYGPANIELIYVDTDDDIREQRAISRGSFDKTEWDRRLADDNIKFSKEIINAIRCDYGKPITVINNNGETPIYSKI